MQRKTISPENALMRLASLCAQSEQAESDLRAKLTKWGISASDANKIISRLIADKYIDENRYAKAFVRDRFRFAGWGKIKIAFTLKQKGFNESVIAEALSEISDEEYSSALLSAMKSKAKSVKNKEPMQARASIARFAASRGYEPALIFKLIPKVLNNDFCDETDLDL